MQKLPSYLEMILKIHCNALNVAQMVVFFIPHPNMGMSRHDSSIDYSILEVYEEQAIYLYLLGICVHNENLSSAMSFLQSVAIQLVTFVEACSKRSNISC